MSHPDGASHLDQKLAVPNPTARVRAPTSGPATSSQSSVAWAEANRSAILSPLSIRSRTGATGSNPPSARHPAGEGHAVASTAPSRETAGPDSTLRASMFRWRNRAGASESGRQAVTTVCVDLRDEPEQGPDPARIELRLGIVQEEHRRLVRAAPRAPSRAQAGGGSSRAGSCPGTPRPPAPAPPCGRGPAPGAAPRRSSPGAGPVPGAPRAARRARSAAPGPGSISPAGYGTGAPLPGPSCPRQIPQHPVDLPREMPTPAGPAPRRSAPGSPPRPRAPAVVPPAAAPPRGAGCAA